MNPRVAACADRFELVNNDLIGVVEGCTDDQWRQPCVDEERSIGVVAYHVAVVYPAFARMVETFAAGQTYSPQSSFEQVDRSNAVEAQSHAAVGQAETLAALRANGADVARQLRRLRDEQLDRVAGIFGSQELRVLQVVEWVVIGHTSEHLGSIRATLAA